MELKNLLSVVIAALTALGAMLFAMGSQSPWLAVALWMAAVVSLVVTDFFGVVRVPRNLASLLMWGVLAIFLPHFLVQSSWDSRLQIVASILLCLQMALLFQEKDARVYGWLAVISLLQAVVAARYSQGVAFGGLLIAFTILGIFALSLLALYGQWGRHGAALALAAPPLGDRNSPKGGTTSANPPEGGSTSARWPLAAGSSSFISTPAGSGRSGVVFELFARLALIAAGALFLAAIMFSTVPRPGLSAWPRDSRKTVATVGFDDKIELGRLGETIENPQEVMQLKLLDKDTGQVYPMRDNVYLRGSLVNSYSHNQWRYVPPPKNAETDPQPRPGNALPERVVQWITMEPYLDRRDVFCIWPPVEPMEKRLHYDGVRLTRRPGWRDARGGDFTCHVVTSGLENGHQAPLVPASGVVRVSQYLKMPGDPWPLPGLKRLAAQWLRGSGLPAHEHYQVARCFERQLSSSGQFQYSLQGQDRDTTIDAIEDFVCNNRRGHCEYFATSLALMLRSQGIPSRVVLGYRCDKWHEDQKCYQVRQLHAHAWVEAFLDPEQIPEALRHSEPNRWEYGGWLRLDATPAADVGTQAAQRTVWGAWQGAGTACNTTGKSTSSTWIASNNANRSMSRFPGRRGTSRANCSIPTGGKNLRPACGPPWPPCCEAV